VDLYLTVDPAADTVQPAFIATIGGVAGTLTSLGPPQPIPAAWVSGTQALAVGLISTSRGPAPPFPATWDFLNIRFGGAVECSVDAQCADNNPCTDDVCQSFTCLHLNNTSPCDDGLACTTGDVCAAGSCSGTDACPSGEFCSAAQNACAFINADLDNDGLVGAADPCPTDARNLCFGPVATDTAQNKPLRINAGVGTGACYGVKTDCAGGVWNGDFGYNQSTSAFACDLNGGGTGCVFNGVSTLFGCDSAATEDLFRCEHWDDTPAPELSYAFTVPNGPYLVNLYFANAYHLTTNVGDRVFNILVQGQTVYSNFDQVAASGGSANAVVRSAIANVSNGTLAISFGHVTENPAIKAIEVLRQDRDHDGFFPPNDCNDLDPAVHPGALDNTCNGIDENCSGVADEGYVSVATTCGVGACGRTGATSCVAGSVRDSCAPGAPTAETCNGIDDNCDGIIDNAAPLTTTADLTVALSGTSGTALSWPAVSGASAYDLLRGDDGTLVTTGGNFSQAVTSCLADNTAGLSATDAAVPQSGAAFFYLLRAVNCGGGSWEGGDPAQVGVRGPSIAASPLACP
jgi:hypothetical protein